jgi:hypothetical protein
MLCNYINNIYLEHIHPNLLDVEFIYSQEVKETFLDMWNSVDGYKICPKYPDSVFYIKDSIIVFETYNNTHINFKSLFFYKNFRYRHSQFLVECIIKKLINMYDWENISKELINDINACELKQKTTQFDLSGLVYV